MWREYGIDLPAVGSLDETINIYFHSNLMQLDALYTILYDVWLQCWIRHRDLMMFFFSILFVSQTFRVISTSHRRIYNGETPQYTFCHWSYFLLVYTTLPWPKLIIFIKIFMYQTKYQFLCTNLVHFFSLVCKIKSST